MGLLGRAWVSSLPKFFLGKYFHFWKLPPGFCINSRDNVYYPIFLGSIWYTVLTLEYTENCIVSVPASVKTLSQNEGFSLGKAHESVFSLPNPSLYPQHQNHIPNCPQYHNNPTHYTQQHCYTQQHYYFVAPTTRHNTNDLACLYYQATQHNNTQTIQQHYNTQKNPLQLTLQPYNTNNI